MAGYERMFEGVWFNWSQIVVVMVRLNQEQLLQDDLAFGDRMAMQVRYISGAFETYIR